MEHGGWRKEEEMEVRRVGNEDRGTSKEGAVPESTDGGPSCRGPGGTARKREQAAGRLAIWLISKWLWRGERESSWDIRGRG